MTQQESDLPTELAAPARRALIGAGYSRLEQLTKLSEAEVKQLHGIGPNALNQLRRALTGQAARAIGHCGRVGDHKTHPFKRQAGIRPDMRRSGQVQDEITQRDMPLNLQVAVVGEVAGATDNDAVA